MDENQVRSDLKKLAKKNKYIKVLFDTIEHHKKHLAYISDKKTEDTLKQSIQKFERATKEALKLEDKYMDCILRLDMDLQTAILGHYILCKSTQKIAFEMSYDARNVCFMYSKACKKIAQMLNQEAGE